MSEPLDLEMVKARLEHVAYGLQAREDVTALLAEVERLRGEAESEARARRFNSKMSNYLMDVIGRDEPEVREAEARIKAGDNHSEENSFGHIAAAYIMRLRGEVARQAEQITTIEGLEALPQGQWLIGWDHLGYGHIGYIELRPDIEARGIFWQYARGTEFGKALQSFGPLTVVRGPS